MYVCSKYCHEDFGYKLEFLNHPSGLSFNISKLCSGKKKTEPILPGVNLSAVFFSGDFHGATR